MVDDAVLGAPMNIDDNWSIRAVSAPELALRVKGVTKYWQGDVRVENVRVSRSRRRAPPRGWVTEDDPSNR